MPPLYAGSVSQLGNMEAAMSAEERARHERAVENFVRNHQYNQAFAKAEDDSAFNRAKAASDLDLRRQYFNLNQTEGAANRALQSRQLDIQEKEIGEKKLDKAAAEKKSEDNANRSMFGGLFGAISKGDINDQGELVQAAEGLPDEKLGALRTHLDNVRGRRMRDYFTGARDAARELTTQFNRTDSPAIPAVPADVSKVYRSDYIDQTGVDPNTDPLFNPALARNILTQRMSTPGWFGVPSKSQRDIDLAQQQLNAATAAADIGRAKRFRTFADTELKNRNNAAAIIPDIESFSFRPRQPSPADLNLEYATDPNVTNLRTYFSLGGTETGTNGVPGQAAAPAPSPSFGPYSEGQTIYRRGVPFRVVNGQPVPLLSE